MDKRIHYRIVLDAETCPTNTAPRTGVNPYEMLVYDIGWAIVDKRGKVYATRSFVNANIFLGEKTLMKSAYYSNKIPNYWTDIKNGTRTLTSWYIIKKTFYQDLADWNVDEVYAHNMRFDYATLKVTNEKLSNFKYFFPKSVKVCDTLKMARDVIAKMPTYKKFCLANGFMTKNNQVRLNAETLYRFISKNINFEESHTGLEDVMIEKEIMAYCYKQHKKMRKTLW